MSNHNICLYKEVKKKYTGCNLNTTEFLDCALIGVCAVIRSNTLLKYFLYISQKTRFDISCKLSICMKYQILFSGKNKKNITKLLSAELAKRVVNVNFPLVALQSFLDDDKLIN